MTVLAYDMQSELGDESEDIPGITRPMTYEEYLASPEEMRRYDIIDGYKKYRLYGPEENQLPNPTRLHQRIQMNLGQCLRDFEMSARHGQVIPPPCDVFISRTPRLRTRQPDLLFMSTERLAENPPQDNPAPLSPAPELVVEILSPSDRPSVLAAKIADYRTADVREIWLVRSDAQTVEVLALSWDEILTIAKYGAGETVVSQIFPDLAVAVDAIFAL